MGEHAGISPAGSKPRSSDVTVRRSLMVTEWPREHPPFFLLQSNRCSSEYIPVYTARHPMMTLEVGRESTVD